MIEHSKKQETLIDHYGKTKCHKTKHFEWVKISRRERNLQTTEKNKFHETHTEKKEF